MSFKAQGLTLILALILHSACQNDPPVVSIIPDDELTRVILIDSLEVSTRTVPNDSIITNNFNSYLLGANFNANIGGANAAIVLDFNLPGPNVTFGLNPRLDSVVFSLEYLGPTSFFGDISYQHDFVVHELDERIFRDSVYFSSRRFAKKEPEVGRLTAPFRPADSVALNTFSGSVKVAPHLRIRLDNATIGQKLISAGDANLVDNEAFKNYFKGLRIASTSQPASGQGSFANFFLNAGSQATPSRPQSLSAVTVFYNDSMSIRFVAIVASMKAAEYQNDFNGAFFQSQFTALPGTDFERTFLQSMGGTKIEVRIPKLSGMLTTEERYSVVGARFRFPAPDLYNTTGYSRLPRLLLVAADSNGQNAALPDLTAGFYGGNYSGNGYYEFNIPKSFQNYFDNYYLYGDSNNYGLFLFIPSDNPMTASRTAIDNNPIGNKVEFRLMLTRVGR